jgi:hypothetical protein
MELETLAGPTFMDAAEKLLDLEQPLPNPNLPHLAFVIRDKGAIIGITVVQCMAMIEPFKVDSEPEGGRLSGVLFRYVENYIRETGVQRLMMHTGDAKMQALLERTDGVREVPDKFYEYRPEWEEEDVRRQ